jgi:hypothetical protein
MSEPRRERWLSHDIPTKLSLVVDDLDSIEEGMRDVRIELKGIKSVLIGVLVSVTTAAILLAINLAIAAA